MTMITNCGVSAYSSLSLLEYNTELCEVLFAHGWEIHENPKLSCSETSGETRMSRMGDTSKGLMWRRSDTWRRTGWESKDNRQELCVTGTL